MFPFQFKDDLSGGTMKNRLKRWRDLKQGERVDGRISH